MIVGAIVAAVLMAIFVVLSLQHSERWSDVASLIISLFSVSLFVAYLLAGDSSGLARDGPPKAPFVAITILFLIGRECLDLAANPTKTGFRALSWVLLLIANAPLMLLEACAPGTFEIFDASCRHPNISTYAWFVLDNLMKGTVLDFLQSFDISLNSCMPRKGDFGVSLIRFGLRAFTTYVVLWLVFRTVKQYTTAKRSGA